MPGLALVGEDVPNTQDLRPQGVRRPGRGWGEHLLGDRGEEEWNEELWEGGLRKDNDWNVNK